MKKIGLSVVLLIIFLAVNPSCAIAEWVFQFGTGTALNISTPLEIRQNGQSTLDFTADYETRAWSTQAIYYDLRVGKWKDNRAWEFEMLHHKLFLSNPPPEVQSFNISHGYNLMTLNRAWQTKNFIYRLGLGAVVTHPETTVRGKTYNDEGGLNGFHLGGFTSQAAVEKRFSLWEKLFASVEAKFTASYATIPIRDGDATVPNVAFHGIFGLGYSF